MLMLPIYTVGGSRPGSLRMRQAVMLANDHQGEPHTRGF